MLEHHAPTWLAHLPGVVSPAKLAALQRMAAGTTPGRMVRELANAIEALTAGDALVLCLEDLHWSDASTLDCMATLAARPEPARLLVAATYRPGRLGTDQERPLAALTGGLRAKGLCREIALMGLDEAAVAEYVAREYPAAPGHDARLRLLAARVHRHTGGNALFVVTVLKDLAARGLLRREQAGWTIPAIVETFDPGIPDDVRRTIERQIDRLPADERSLLEIASVAGPAFSAAIVAGAAALPVRDGEARLAGIARHYRFVVEAGLAEWPDGTLATRFEFAHELYRSGFYGSLPAGRRVELHRFVARRLEGAYGARAPEIAAELAMHCDRGRDAARAIAWLQHAAEGARRRSAFNEARLHFERALALLDTGPQGVDRTAEEVKLRIGQGAAIMATRGFGAPEAEAAYSRARAVCRDAGETLALFPALWGLWLFYWGRGAVGTAAEIAHELQALAAAGADEGLRLQAHHASWATAFSRGDFEGTRRHAAEGIAMYEAGRHAVMGATYGSHDTGVCARMFSARAAVILGQAGEAIRMSDDAMALARALEHRFSIALALTFARLSIRRGATRRPPPCTPVRRCGSAVSRTSG